MTIDWAQIPKCKDCNVYGDLEEDGRCLMCHATHRLQSRPKQKKGLEQWINESENGVIP